MAKAAFHGMWGAASVCQKTQKIARAFKAFCAKEARAFETVARMRGI